MSKSTEAQLRKALATADARVHAMNEESLLFAGEVDVIMEVMVEVLRGMRPDHCAYVQKLAQEYVERRLGHAWDEPVRQVRA